MPPGKSPHEHGFRSRRLRVIAGAIAAVLFLAVAFLHSPPVRIRVLRALTSRIAAAGFVARADAIDYNLLTLTVRLSNLSLATPSAAATPFFRVKEVKASVPWSVLKGQFSIGGLEVVSPAVTLHRDAQGHDNWTTDHRDQGPSSLTALHIEHLVISDLTVDWTDDQQLTHVDAALSLDLVANRGATSGPIVMARPATVRWHDRATSVSVAGGRLSWNDRDLALEGLSLGAAEGTLRVDGRLSELLQEPHLDARVDADVNLEAASPWMNLDRRLTGTTQAAAHVTGDAVDLTSLRTQIAGGELVGRGRASFSGAGSLHLTWERLDLAELLRSVLTNPPRVLPAARATGSLDAQWTAATLEGLQLTASSRLQGDRAQKGRTDPPVAATAALEVNGRKWKLSADRVEALGASATADLNGTLDTTDLQRSTVAGTLHARTIGDDREWARALVRAGWLREVPPVRGAISGDFVVGGTLGAPSLDGGLDATVQYENLAPARILARASAAPDAIGLTDIDARLPAGMVRGAVRWSPGSDALAGQIDGSLSLKDLPSLSPSIPRSLALGGSVEVSATAAGTLARPRIAVRTIGDALEVSGQTIDRLSGDLRVAGSDLILDRLVLEQSTGRVEASGSFSPGRNSYTGRLTATGVSLHPVLEINGQRDASMSGLLNATFEGSGTLADPHGRGHLSLAATRWGSADLGAIDADVTLAGRSATFTLDARDVALNGHGAVALDPAGPVSVAAVWQPGDVAAIARRLALNIPVSGPAALAAEWNATRDHLADGRGWLILDRADLLVASQSVRLSQPGRIDADGRVIRVTPIVLTTGSSSLTIDGALRDARTSGRLALTLDGSLADFGFVRDLLQPRTDGAPERPTIAGAVHALISAEDAAGAPRVSGTFSIGAGRVPVTDSQAVTGIEVAARFDQGVLFLDRAMAAFEGASLSATARVPSNVFLDRLPAALRQYVPAVSGPAMFSAQVGGITTSVAAPFVDPSTLAQVALQADASIDLQADGATIDRVHGSATLSRAELTLAGVSFDQQVPTRLTIRDGRVTVDAFRWGRETNQVVLEGGVVLGDRASIDLLAKAALDLRMLNAFVPAARTTGRGDAEVRVAGTLETPTIDGHVTLTGGEVRIADPRMVVGDINGTINLARDRVNVEHVSATINGGEAELTGSIRHEKLNPVDGSVTLTAKAVALDLAGVRAETNATLTWALDANGPAVHGTVTLLRSAFRERLSLTGGLLAALRRSSAPVRTPSTSLLDRTRLDVRLVTDEDLLVDNNLAQLTITGDLRAVGTLSYPSLTGRATLAEGGTLFFNGTRYRLQDQGFIDFANPDHIEPDLDLRAVTRVQGNEITLTLKGTPATLETTLDSDNPMLSQSDLVSLLLIGRTAGNGEEDLAAGGDQLVGLLTSGFLEAAGRAVGFDTARVERGEPDVRMDAGLVASETDPGARLTVGKNIGTHFEVVFSQSLQQSGGLTWIIGYKPRPGIDLRVVSLDDGDRLYTFSHDLTFANPARKKAATARPATRVSDVVITGSGADESALRSHLKVKPGDSFSFFRWQDDRERVEDFYREQRRLEAHVVTRRTSEPSDAARVRLTYDVTPGLRTTVVVDGFALSKSSLSAIDRAWERSVADDFLTEEVTEIARADLADSGFVLPSVTAHVQNGAGSRELRVTIAPGQHVDERRVEFSGNSAESSDRLLSVIADRGLTKTVWTRPDDVRDALAAFYRTNGYLNAAIRVDPVSVTGKTAIRPIHIDEGGAFRVAAVQVEGAHAIPADEVTRLIGLSAGDRYAEDRLDQVQRALDAAYRARGYNRVGIDCQARTPPAGAGALAVDVVVRVDEGPQQRLREVVTTGLARTNPKVVSGALKLDVGTPVNLAAWNAARKRVYETGAFRSVDIEREVIEPAGSTPVSDEEPVRARVTVQEWPLLRFRYGFEVRDDVAAAGDAARSNTPETELPGGRTLGLGLAGDLGARGLFGRGISAGVAGRYTPDERASRAYGTAASFFGRPIASTVFIERSLEQSGAARRSDQPEFQTLKRSITFEQRLRPRKGTTISYLYTYERNHTLELNPDPFEPLPFDVMVTIGRFSSALVMDRRDDPINPAQGWFHSSSMTFAPGALGSDLRYVKYFVQQYYYHLAGPVVVAVAGKVGLATAFESTLTPDERFFAGGGNSVRGYAQDVLSPRDASGGAVGGNALIVINQEVRFPIFKIVRGVGFFDAGHAFERVSDLSIRDLATSAGFGLRLHTPLVLVRVDLGVPFETVSGVRRPRWFFSIGQLF